MSELRYLTTPTREIVAMTAKWIIPGFLSLLGMAGCGDHAPHGNTPTYTLEQVVMVMRHGVRAQTDSYMLARETGQPWASSSVPDGELTAHGAEGAASQAAWMIEQWRKAGLPLEEGCPERQVLAWTSPTPRARDTGEAALDAMFPGCGMDTYHTTRAKDPVMKGQKAVEPPLDETVVTAELQKAAGGDVSALGERYRADVERLRAAVCLPGACQFMDTPWAAHVKGNKVSFEGPLKYAGNMAETIRLQYSEGLPLDQVAFGHVKDATDVTALMSLQAVRYSLGNDLPEVARHGGSALMGLLTQALEPRKAVTSDPLAQPLVMFFGHDTNISQLRTMLGFDWQLAGYPHNDIPPAGALVFERYHDRQRDREMVRVSFQARSLDQWRQLSPLSAAAPLEVSEWRFEGCEDTNVGVLCPLDDVLARMKAHQDSALLAPADYLTQQIEKNVSAP